MSNFAPTNYEFTDDSPVQKGRKHRRSRANNSKGSSFKSQGYNSPAVSTSLNANQSPNDSQTQYYTANTWDSNPNNVSVNSKNKDDNSCAGSLTYSASSSVQSGMSSGGESSNDSSFADIINLIDKEGEGANEIKAFIAAQSEAATEEGGAAGGGTAVAGWRQRKQQQMLMQNAITASGRQGRHPNRPNVPLNYSRDDSDDEGQGENLLETITGRDEEVSRRHTITVTTRSQKSSSPREDNNASPYGFTNPSRHGAVTPPPSMRNKRTSTPPDSVVRTRSKSSSDGSWDTPTASPSSSRPPSARSTWAAGSRRNITGKGETAQDISQPVYLKSWMCGFTDSFNFDNFKLP